MVYGKEFIIKTKFEGFKKRLENFEVGYGDLLDFTETLLDENVIDFATFEIINELMYRIFIVGERDKFFIETLIFSFEKVWENV